MQIRAFQESDKDFIVSLALRFMDFEPDEPGVIQTKWKNHRLSLAQESVDNLSPGTEIFVAEDETGELLGFLEVQPHKDKLNDIEQGYIVAIAVSPQGEGKGVGKGLMTKAEEWSRQKGYRQLILNVFNNNLRAVNFYKHLNYEIEVVKMVKEL